MYWLTRIASALSSLQQPLQHDLPYLHLHLTPHSAQNGSSINVHLTANFEPHQSNTTLFWTQLSIANIPLSRWAGNVSAWDASGSLHLEFHDETDDRSGVRRNWFATRETQGGLELVYTVLPREVSVFDRCRTLADLQEEHTGLLGPGVGWLLLPALENEFELSINWDFSSLPSSVRAVTSYGEGNLLVRSTTEALAQTLFVIGAVKSYEDDYFGLYWLDQPPFDAAKLGQQLSHLSSGLASFFHSPISTFRVFVRHNRHRCAAGTAFHNSFMFGHTDLFPEQRSEIEQLEFLLHEMVHNWLRLDEPSYELAWWTEGIAEYYSVMLPFRLGIHSEELTIDRFNRKLEGYYTNPAVRCNNAEIAEGFWTDGHMQRMAYQRGFVYFAILEVSIFTHSPDYRSLEDLMLEMHLRYKNNLPHGLSTWLGLLERELGEDFVYDLQRSLSNGDLLISATELFGRDYSLTRTDQEQFYLGFNERSLNPSDENSTVTGLDRASRASVEGGLRESDIVTLVSSPVWSLEAYDRNMTLVVKREVDGEMVDVRLTWWPRSWEKFEGYRYVYTGHG